MALLDVNVLVALFDPDHLHHEASHQWFGVHQAAGWATCPLTENGLLRVLSNPAYSPVAERPAQIAERLRTLCRHPHHHFWPDDISFRETDLFGSRAPASHRQVTDLYLLGLAVKRDGCLATFDRAIHLAGLRGAKPHHLDILTV